MKKFIVVLTALLMLNTSVFADNLGDSVLKVLTHLNIETDGDLSPLMYCKNYSFIPEEYKEAVATGLKHGILATDDGVINAKSSVLKPLYYGIASYSIKNDNYRLVAGYYVGNKIGGATVDSNTLCLDELMGSELYTAMIDKSNNAVIVWKSGNIVLPTLYRANVYICGDGNLVLYNAERYSFDSWINIMSDKSHIDVPCTALTGITEEEINLDYLDKTVYFIADGYTKEINPVMFEFQK